MVVVVDNYDSFAYNLAQYIGELGESPAVFRNDEVTVEEIGAIAPTHIVISPGPCTPREAGISNGVVRALAGQIPILGVCLGHQCIAYAFGAIVTHANTPVHGKRSTVFHDGRGVYEGLPNPIEAGRYHSLVVQEDGLPACLQITARTADCTIMGLRHKEFSVEGVQFHPESIMTPEGHNLLRNFLAVRQAKRIG